MLYEKFDRMFRPCEDALAQIDPRGYTLARDASGKPCVSSSDERSWAAFLRVVNARCRTREYAAHLPAVSARPLGDRSPGRSQLAKTHDIRPAPSPRNG